MEHKFGKPVVIGMATYAGKGRDRSISEAIASLRGHGALLYLYDNSKHLVNLTDNGKFHGLVRIKEPCYYFTCDDDLIYPPDYIPEMIEKIKEHKCIVTHHGRTLTRKGIPYYRGHKSFRCLTDNLIEEKIHVAGTGVTAFDTEYFNPIHLWSSKDLRMSDLVFSLEAAKQGKDIMVLKHSTGYIKHSKHIDLRNTIFASEQNNKRQTEIADEIFKLKWQKPSSQFTSRSGSGRTLSRSKTYSTGFSRR